MPNKILFVDLLQEKIAGNLHKNRFIFPLPEKARGVNKYSNTVLKLTLVD